MTEHDSLPVVAKVYPRFHDSRHSQGLGEVVVAISVQLFGLKGRLQQPRPQPTKSARPG